LIKFGAGAVAILLAFLLVRGFIFGGGDNGVPSVRRPGSIPTATPPAETPEPILLAETRGGAANGATTGGAAPGTTYVVKSGDTLGAIASQFNVAPDQQAAWVAEVLRLNGIADARLLAAGVELRLPSVPTATPTPRSATTASPTPAQAAAPSATPTLASAANTPTATPPPAATVAPTATRPPVTGGAGTYTVVANDNPSVIADKLGVPTNQQAVWVAELIALNAISPTGLQIGQVLQLPAGTPSGGAGTQATPVGTPPL
jgi:LysM repeat protein